MIGFQVPSPGEVNMQSINCNCKKALTDSHDRFCIGLPDYYMQSTVDISKSKFIPNCLYLKVNFLVPENLL